MFSKFFNLEGLLVTGPWGSGLMRAGLPTAGGGAPMDITAPLSVPAGDAGETAAAAAAAPLAGEGAPCFAAAEVLLVVVATGPTFACGAARVTEAPLWDRSPM